MFILPEAAAEIVEVESYRASLALSPLHGLGDGDGLE
jgi:hypothetical protein